MYLEPSNFVGNPIAQNYFWLSFRVYSVSQHLSARNQPIICLLSLMELDLICGGVTRMVWLIQKWSFWDLLGCFVTGQKVNWIFLSCEHDFVFRVFIFVLNGRQLSSCRRRILCYHCLLVVEMTTSRRLVSLGRKLCLFVYHVKQVDNKQMGGQGCCKHSMERENRTVHDNIRKGVQGQMEEVYWFGWLCCKRVEVGACWDW
jgi:hypothetical protein